MFIALRPHDFALRSAMSCLQLSRAKDKMKLVTSVHATDGTPTERVGCVSPGL